ncbi:MAG: ABC transporter ATP-binding protein [Candidatus Pacebacteria bacterium]|jgi:putative ABC transport system ATP-binding protein|nr:ABC transporter ATP-binding protein [Candidatus Paceibacterota bacterium]MDD3072531.1 ABC transporter ATP-binding protein [Candidatus Paceibacterota bacterium]MDD3728977.1 ABC transporter ATP-binding protein [Candidatus Paceibacterota bacterium]MDD4201649.1 ABC transporter ATP-binding protein [Candidatus Paceibacterota bacterium]MDD4467052.1 ABC transporter ATP-binding protein [Candidatus Paceibacterota bacterium]
MDSLIRLENVWKIYKPGKVEFVALKDANLEIKSGEFITIVGSSGSGKSTLLHIVGCLDLPSRGNVFLKGENISDFSQDKLAEIRGEKIGFVFQQFNLLMNLTAFENVTLPMLFNGFSEKERTERAKELLSSLGLEKKLHRKPNEMSGGEMQRVAIARALANDPDLILADEPTGNVDSKTGEKIMEILDHLNKREKKTIVVITHDPEIARHGEHIIRIKDGEITKESNKK